MIFSLATFLIISFFSFTIPGVLILSKSKMFLSSWERVFLGTVVGFVAFTLLSYLLLLLGLEFLLIPAVLAALFLFIKKPPLKFLSLSLPNKKRVFWILLVFVIGVLGQLAVIFPSGVNYRGDLLFWSSHGHDASWHIALTNEIQNGWPLENPAFAGERLINYHFFSDIAPSFFEKFTNINALDLYFRFFPFIFSILLGSSAYFLAKKISNSKKAALWSSFFVYFVGSFGYFVTFLKDKTLGGESIFWATQIQSSIGNPPQIISNFLLLSFFFFFFDYLKKKDNVILGILVLIGGSLSVFKVYAALVLFIALGLVSVFQLVKERKLDTLKVFIPSGILSAVIFLPNTSGSAGFLIFEPWWFIRTMIVEPSRLDWLDAELRRQTFIYEKNWKRVVFLEGIGFFIFFFGNLGTRFIGIFEFVKILKKSLYNYFNLTLLLVIISSLLLPLLFLQKGVASNTSQFLQYFLLLFGVLAGISTAKILGKLNPFSRIIFVIAIVILSVPTQVALLHQFYQRPAFAQVSKEELAALNFLSHQESSVVLVQPFLPGIRQDKPSPNIWAWADTSYVAAFSGQRVYFTNTEQLDILGYDFKERENKVKEIFSTTNAQDLEELVKTTTTDLIYFPKELSPQVNLFETSFTRVFSNEAVEVWKVDKN